MQQDAVTKDIFRELDGYLSLMSVLASLSVGVDNIEEVASPATPVLVEPPVQLQEDMQECVKLVFLVLSESMEGSVENEAYFRVRRILSTWHHIDLTFTDQSGLRGVEVGFAEPCG